MEMHPTEPSRHRALADIDVDMVTMARSNEEGGCYDPSDDGVFFVFGGEVQTDEEEAPDLDEEDWVAIERDSSHEGFADRPISPTPSPKAAWPVAWHEPWADRSRFAVSATEYSNRSSR